LFSAYAVESEPNINRLRLDPPNDSLHLTTTTHRLTHPRFRPFDFRFRRLIEYRGERDRYDEAPSRRSQSPGNAPAPVDDAPRGEEREERNDRGGERGDRGDRGDRGR
jgi:hypothetical protein